jgi:small-conductance mechanosensitive channel
MNFFWNIIISTLFWGFTLPTGTYMEITGTVNYEFKFAIDHTLPLTYLTIDWFLNGINFEWSHIGPNVAILLVYGLVNYLYVTITGEEVYPVLTWDSGLAWAAAGGVAIIVVLV